MSPRFQDSNMPPDIVRTSIIVDRKMWAMFKAQCTLENKTVAELIEELIKKYLASKQGH